MKFSTNVRIQNELVYQKDSYGCHMGWITTSFVFLIQSFEEPISTLQSSSFQLIPFLVESIKLISLGVVGPPTHPFSFFA